MTQDKPMPSRQPTRSKPTCGDYGGRRKGGLPCSGRPVIGTKRCRMHAGMSVAAALQKGQVVVELQRWGIDGVDELRDPGEVLLRLVTQSAARVQLYSGLLEQAYSAAARKADGEVATLVGGVAALIGHKYAVDKEGTLFPTEEAIRGLVQLEGQERDRCAGMAAKAVHAGLAERQVRLAEQQGALMYGVFARVLAALDLDAARSALVPGLLEREIRALTG